MWARKSGVGLAKSGPSADIRDSLNQTEKSHNTTSLFKIVEKRKQLLDSGQYDKLGCDDREPYLSKKNSAIFNKSFS